MAEFTQAQIADFGQKAVAFLGEAGKSIAQFIGLENGNALFGVRLNAPKGCKVGMPVFVAVSPSGGCREITDLDDCIRLHKIMRSKS